MDALDTLLSLLGWRRSASDPPRETTVTVEYEPRVETEAAVKGSGIAAERSGSADDGPAESAGDDGPTESAGDDGPTVATDDDDGPTESAGDDGPAVATDDDDGPTESAGEATAERTDAGADGATADPDDTPEPAESVRVIEGIGPACADRLSAAGVDTVADLAAADAEALAAATDLSPKRLGRWVERASDRRE